MRPGTLMMIIAVTKSAGLSRCVPSCRLQSSLRGLTPRTSLASKLFSSLGSGGDDRRDDSIHRKHYKIAGTGKRSAVTITTDTGHVLQTDVPKKMGGLDSAPQPVEHLLAALLGCTQATAIFVGRMMSPRMLIDKIDFDVEAHRDNRGAVELPIDKIPEVPARLQRVSGTVEVYFKKGHEVSQEQLNLLAEQTEARCPVANMMHSSGCHMDLKWKIGSQ
mmetsp:Transcript_8807/g.17759  ORF Transcript_8807/g.17759 Transcript_8807/m.17759 type:complete len:219 (-) Transcript_8807:580-1236(-)